MHRGIYPLPRVEICCGCVTDLKTAVAIIAVLGVVTSPSVSWAVVRHAFVIRVSCYVTNYSEQADVVDVNLNNILSFGFGANAGLARSCLSSKSNKTIHQTLMMSTGEIENLSDTAFIKTIRWIGWGVLISDLVFIGFSLNFLVRLFRAPEDKAIIRFMISCIIAVLASFMYGMLYVAACMIVGGAFPLFEFVFSFIDLITWIYFLLVVHSYRHSNA